MNKIFTINNKYILQKTLNDIMTLYANDATSSNSSNKTTR